MSATSGELKYYKMENIDSACLGDNKIIAFDQSNVNACYMLEYKMETVYIGEMTYWSRFQVYFQSKKHLLNYGNFLVNIL